MTGQPGGPLTRPAGVNLWVAGTAVTLVALSVLPGCGGPPPSLPAQERPPAAATSATPAGPTSVPPAPTTSPTADDPTTTPTAAPPPRPAVTRADRALVAAFLRFAADPRPGTASAVGFADRVRLGLTDDVRRVVDRAQAADRRVWRFRIEPSRGWRGRDGTVDVLALVAAPAAGHEVRVGPHPHCASPPVPAPRRAAGLRRVSVQPRGIPDCNDWWTVDLFVDGDGRVRVVTADVWEP